MTQETFYLDQGQGDNGLAFWCRWGETMVHIVLAVLALDSVIVLCCGLLDISDYYPLILYEGVGVF